MAEKRRLQQEVERTLKRVDEGCDLFFDMYEKLRMQQSPKTESELKREIKKLQKLRDQIKAWQTHPDIKDKAPLDDARKRIERGMEAFKQCERESKIKAFSKEGLASRPRQTGPEDRHRDKLQELLQQLQRETECFTAEIEGLNPRKGRRERDRRRLEQQVERHKWHIGKLEAVLRQLDNEGMQLRCIDSLIEGLQDYLANACNADHPFNNSLYDCLQRDSDDSQTDGANSKDTAQTPDMAQGTYIHTPAPAAAAAVGGSATCCWVLRSRSVAIGAEGLGVFAAAAGDCCCS